MSLPPNISRSRSVSYTPPGGDTTAPLKRRGSTGTLMGRTVSRVQHSNSLSPPSARQNPVSNQPGPVQRRARQDNGTGNIGLRREARYNALPGRAQLIAKAGRPKADGKWFGLFGTYKNSTGYKALLTGLDDYNKAVQNTTDQRPVAEQLGQLRDQLDTLEQAAANYQNKKTHSRKQAIGEFQQQVRQEAEIVKDLLNQLDQGAQWPADMSLARIMAYARQGIGLADIGALNTRGLSPEAARQAIDLRNSGMTEQAYQPYREAGFNGTEARLLNRSGLGIQGGQAYRRMDLPITERTLVGDFTRRNLRTHPSELGSGAFNTTYRADYQLSDGTRFKGVIKPLAPPDPKRTAKQQAPQEVGIGIDPKNPQYAMRNIATRDLADALGFDVVPRTEIGTHDGQPVLVMERAPGNTGEASGEADYSNPDVKRELTKLQLLDALTGQSDRHYGNYFIHVDKTTGAGRVTGIDNDMSFGKNLDDPQAIADMSRNAVGLPPVVDTDMVQAFRNLSADPNRLEQLLRDKNLSADEIAAAKGRLTAIMNHLNQLPPQNIIAPNQWGDARVHRLLMGGPSYVGRDFGGIFNIL